MTKKQMKKKSSAGRRKTKAKNYRLGHFLGRSKRSGLKKISPHEIFYNPSDNHRRNGTEKPDGKVGENMDGI
jgi:hypothetical protein